MGLIKRRKKKSSIDNISLKSKKRSGVMTGGALGVAAGAVAGAAAGIFNKKRKGKSAPIVDNGVTNVNEKHTDEIIENNVPKVEEKATETIVPKEDTLVEDITLNNNNNQSNSGTLNLAPEVKDEPKVEEPKIKDEPKVKEEPKSFVIEDGPDEKTTVKSEDKPKTSSISTTKHEKFKSSDKDTSSKKTTTSTKKEESTKSEEHTAEEEPKKEENVVEEKSPVKEAEETPSEEKVVEEKSPVKEVEEKVEEITPEGEVVEEKTEVKNIDEGKEIEETRSTLVAEPVEQDYLLITTGEIEDNISKINTAVKSVKDVWNGLINTDLSNLEKSWAGVDAEVYIAKIKELSPKMDSIVQALELLSKTYKNTIDIANEAIEKTKKSIENTNE